MTNYKSCSDCKHFHETNLPEDTSEGFCSVCNQVIFPILIDCPSYESAPASKEIMGNITTTDWLTRGIPEKKLAKEKSKAIKQAERWARRHPKKVMARALGLIEALCIDYDGFETVEGLKSLIDDISNIAKEALENSQ